MHDTTRVRQALHQQSGATGMIEMNVRQENVINVTDIQVLLTQTVQQEGDAIVRAGINECTPAILDNEVTRVL
jgi:hypothetical protein